MKTYLKQTTKIFIALVTLICTGAALSAQTRFSSQISNISLTGTSTLHDWEMKAENKGNTEALFQVGTNDKLVDLTKLTFVLPATALKSHSGTMDKNAYKALKTDKNQNINFVLTTADIVSSEGNTYQIKCKGNLTIAGTTRETELLATGKYNPADKSLTISGSKKMKMTDYAVNPPSVMFGTIKTGNDITIAYSLKLIK